MKNHPEIKGLVSRHGTGLFRLLERDEIKLGRDDGAFFFRAPDAAQHGSASRGPLYFAWGCFRDFLSRPCRAPLKGRYAGSGTRHRWCLAFTERIDPTPNLKIVSTSRPRHMTITECPGHRGRYSERTRSGAYLVAMSMIDLASWLGSLVGLVGAGAPAS